MSYAVLHAADFALQAVVRTEAGRTRQVRTIDLEPIPPERLARQLRRLSVPATCLGPEPGASAASAGS